LGFSEILMRTSKRVEIALFQWFDWKRSIGRQWIKIDVDLEKYSLGQLRNMAIDRLCALGLQPLIQFQIYWLCCVVSDYRLKDPKSYENICIPPWLHSKFEKVMDLALLPQDNNNILPFTINSRVVPPELYTAPEGMPHVIFSEVERDVFPVSFKDNDKDVARWWEKGTGLSLDSQHELYWILKSHKGRPRERRAEKGTPAKFPDRLAITCAVLRDSKQMTIANIARKLNLVVTHPDFSDRSDITRHLISRGRNLLTSLEIYLDIHYQ
jgi:hypothetical protein